MTPPPKVLIAEAVNASLRPLAGLEVEERTELWRNRGALLEAVAGAHGLVVRNQVRVDVELLDAAPGLRVIGRLGAGLDNLDLDALRDRGVSVVHGGGLNARAVAEYVIGAALDLARRLARSDREVRGGGWHRRVGFELKGKTLGVIGLGATGAETARLGLAMGMTGLGFDPHLEPPEGVAATSLDDLLVHAHVLSLHVPLTRATRGLIGARELELLPDGAIVINAARGGVVDEAALLAALESGHLGGAALDVREQEPPPSGDPLAARDDVLLTPHLAGLTLESQQAIAAHVLTGVRSCLLAASEA